MGSCCETESSRLLLFPAQLHQVQTASTTVTGLWAITSIVNLHPTDSSLPPSDRGNFSRAPGWGRATVAHATGKELLAAAAKMPGKECDLSHIGRLCYSKAGYASVLMKMD